MSDFALMAREHIEKHPLIKAVPNYLNWITDTGKSTGFLKTINDEAVAFSSIIGLSYEALATFFPQDNLWTTLGTIHNYRRRINKAVVREGLLDPYMINDLAANYLGAMGGGWFFIYADSGRNIHDVAKQIDKEEYGYI